jgi:hypothetical protein
MDMWHHRHRSAEHEYEHELFDMCRVYMSMSSSTLCRLYSVAKHIIELVLVDMVSVRLSAYASWSQRWPLCG